MENAKRCALDFSFSLLSFHTHKHNTTGELESELETQKQHTQKTRVCGC